jgi:hypothetical protein
MSVDVEVDDETSQYEDLKTCKKCGVDKPLSDFYDNHSASDGKFSKCKVCVNEDRKRQYQEKKRGITDVEVSKLDRVTKFIKGFLDPKDLTDDELMGRYILNEQKFGDSDKVLPAGHGFFKVPFAVIENSSGSRASGGTAGRFQAKLNKELSLRLNEYIKSKSMRAIQVVFEIADSELVEPGDRFKAATWLAERVIGKTPEVLLTGDASKVYETIFDTSVESGSREDYRKSIESSRGESLDDSGSNQRGRNNSASEILDAETEEDYIYGQEDDLEASPGIVGYGSSDGSETSGLGNSGQSGVRGFSESVPGAGESTNSFEARDGRDSDTGLTVHGEKRTEYRDEKERLRKARQKAKQRRFAARAVGATSLDRLPYFLEFKIIKTGSLAGKLMCRLIHPDDLTEARLARVEATNADTDLVLSLLYPEVDEDSQVQVGDENGEEPNGEPLDTGCETGNEKDV